MATQAAIARAKRLAKEARARREAKARTGGVNALGASPKHAKTPGEGAIRKLKGRTAAELKKAGA